MGFYQTRILPRLLHLAMGSRELVPYRERTISAAEGRVLEVGIGSGLNLPFYGPRVREILGIDPAPQLLEMARRTVKSRSVPLTLMETSAEAIPLDDASIDTVVTTWSLCTIPDARRALDEMRRVLKPGGQLLFVEHGLAPDEGVRNWQDRLTPVWKRIGGGCHLNRPIQGLIETAGFHLDRIDTGYAKGPKPMSFMFQGRGLP